MLASIFNQSPPQTCVPHSQLCFLVDKSFTFIFIFFSFSLSLPPPPPPPSLLLSLLFFVSFFFKSYLSVGDANDAGTVSVGIALTRAAVPVAILRKNPFIHYSQKPVIPEVCFKSDTFLVRMLIAMRGRGLRWSSSVLFSNRSSSQVSVNLLLCPICVSSAPPKC